MSLSETNNFFLALDEPNRGCMLGLRDIIVSLHSGISQEWKYRLPFFYLHGKMFCYMHIDKKIKHPYIGFVDGGKMSHPMLVKGDRKRMKILPINPNEDLPIELLKQVFSEALAQRVYSSLPKK